VTPSILQPNQESPERVRQQIRRRSVHVFAAAGGWETRIPPRNCEAKEEAAKYEGESPETQIDDVETKEEALEYLRGVKRRREEGKTTRLS